MKRNIENKKGITLISLVVTIIIIIILAGVSLNLILGENGILIKAKSAQKMQDIARISEKLEMEKGKIAIDNEFKATLKEYINQIKEHKIVEENNKDNYIIDEWNVELGSCYIKVEGKYYFKVEQDKENEGNIKITYIGSPLIIDLKEKSSTNSIEVEVIAINANKYEYYIKAEDDEEVEKRATKKEGNYTYENLIKDKKYYIEIVVTGENKEKVRIGKWVTTKDIASLTSGNTTFSYNPSGWTNGDVVATVSTTVTGYTLQTSKDGITWESTASQTYSSNGIVYARLIDSTGQEGGSTTGNVDKIDKTIPESATITISGETTQASLPVILSAKVTHNDNQSGVNITSSKYVINTTSTAIGTNSSTYTGGTFSSNEATIELQANAEGNWYLHVLTVDNAGNAKETISEPIIIENKYHEHTGSSTSGGECYTESNTVTCTVVENSNFLGQANSSNDYLGLSPVYCPGGRHWYVTQHTYKHSICGKSAVVLTANCGGVGENTGCDHRMNKTITTGIGTSNHVINQGWKLSCGKTETTIEGYTITY